MCIKNNKAPRYRKISGALLSKNIFGGQGMKYIDACMYVCMYEEDLNNEIKRRNIKMYIKLVTLVILISTYFVHSLTNITQSN